MIIIDNVLCDILKDVPKNIKNIQEKCVLLIRDNHDSHKRF